MTLRERIGVFGFYLAWPAFYVYLRRSERTRIVVVWQGQVLAIKNWLSDARWSLPGGGLHAGEDSSVGAARELFEETGIRVSPAMLEKLGSGTYRLHGLSYPFQSFVVRLETEPTVRRQWFEVSKTSWMKPEELLPKETSPDVLESLEFLRSRHPDFLIQ
jgi:8-oxo-dGTP pyrophosphatase MutT (NUDIX family)